jgi:hypothetical protein
MTITSRFALAAGTVLALCALAAAPSWGQQGTLRSQTDEVQRAVSEALRQANAGQRRDAARAEAQRRALESAPTRTPESAGPTGSDGPSLPPIPGGDRP